jgi:hypothetical protein
MLKHGLVPAPVPVANGALVPSLALLGSESGIAPQDRTSCVGFGIPIQPSGLTGSGSGIDRPSGYAFAAVPTWH